MSTEYKFPTTLPIDINFFNAESLSPEKLNNIFQYLRSANYSIEMFIGNGIDYNITTNIERKLAGNISNILGNVAGNIYMPYNLLPTIYTLYKNFGSTSGGLGISSINTNQHSSYNQLRDSLSILDTVNIPICRSFDCDVTIGIQYYTNIQNSSNPSNASCTIYSIAPSGTSDVGNLTPNSLIASATLQTNPSSNSASNLVYHKNIVIPANTFIYYIELRNADSANITFEIYDIYLSKIKDDTSEYRAPVYTSIKSMIQLQPSNQTPLNSFYSIGKDNKAFYTCKNPCKYSDPSYNSLGYTCNQRTVAGGCIGNTYDIYVDNQQLLSDKLGIPVCGGTVSKASFLNYVDTSIIPTNGSTTTLQYDTNYDGTASPSFVVFQSPVSTYTNKQHSLKYHPFSLLRGGNIGAVQEGRLYLYDMLSTTGNPILYDTKFITTSRPDIIQAINSKIITDNYNKYLLLGSDLGIAEMNNEMLTVNSESITRAVSVYTD